jgi:hypothetical protein
MFVRDPAELALGARRVQWAVLELRWFPVTSAVVALAVGIHTVTPTIADGLLPRVDGLWAVWC